ncbi:MAG TPA: hypothetical protein VHV56_06150 [Pseudolabrys sp.]|jgi:hypothetical protein|nr:hypothetical protein [Pseudolabrys sp.]
MRYLFVAVALIWSATAAFAADPSGKYTVEGANPGHGSKYEGTVTISKNGDTYRVVWIVGNTRYIGTGIGNDKFIAVSYRSGNETGLALYGAEGDNWQGVWTYAGGNKIGTEVWTRE